MTVSLIPCLKTRVKNRSRFFSITLRAPTILTTLAATLERRGACKQRITSAQLTTLHHYFSLNPMIRRLVALEVKKLTELLASMRAPTNLMPWANRCSNPDSRVVLSNQMRLPHSWTKTHHRLLPNLLIRFNIKDWNNHNILGCCKITTYKSSQKGSLDCRRCVMITTPVIWCRPLRKCNMRCFWGTSRCSRLNF